MTRKRYSRSDIVVYVRRAKSALAEGMSLDQIALELEINPATLKRWLRDYGGPQSQNGDSVKHLEQENRRLRRALARLEFDKKVLAEALRGNF